MHTPAQLFRTTTAPARTELARAAFTLAVAASAVLIPASAVSASDFVHQCRSADGYYTMDDEVLREVDPAKAQDGGKEIKYKILQKVELSRRTGYCVSNKAPQGKNRFDYEGSTYALHISIDRDKEQLKIFMLCDKASSGLPASYDCDKEVATSDWVYGQDGGQRKADVSAPRRSDEDAPRKLDEDEPRRADVDEPRRADANEMRKSDEDDRRTAASRPDRRDDNRQQQREPVWIHNGSEVRIIAEGSRRRVVYVSPRQKLLDRGIKAGDVVFDGERKGDEYIGTAYIIHRRCGNIPYEVRGRVIKGETRIVMEGRRPLLAKGCKTRDWKDVRVVVKRQ